MSKLHSLIACGMLMGCLRLAVLANPRPQQSTTGTAASNLSPDEVDKVHRRLFGNALGSSLDETITQKLSHTTGDLMIKGDHISESPARFMNLPSYPPWQLTAMSCPADLVVAATAQSGTSHMTENQRFLYTDWLFTVTEVLKDNSRVPLHVPGGTIIVVKPGGQLQIGDRVVRALEDNFKDFKSGEPYLLFLHFIPETKAYKAEAEEVFVLSDNKVSHLTRNPISDVEANLPNTVLTDTRAAVSANARNPRCIN